MLIRKGLESDIDELEVLYDSLNDFLEANINYPGWIKSIYPIRETAARGIKENSLFVLEIDGRIAGSVILNYEPEDAYNQVEWGVDTGYDAVIVVHTLVTHPDFMHRGVASVLMSFAKEYACGLNMKAIRLDVSVNNTAAIALYERLGYKYIGTVDLELGYEHLKWFRLYEMTL